MRLSILALSVIGLLGWDSHVRADGYASAQAQASTGSDYVVTPQAAIVPQAAPSCAASALGAGCSYDVQAAPVLQTYTVPVQQQVIVQRQVVAQPVYVQRQVVQRQVYVQQAPVLQQAVVTPYVPQQAQALAQVNSYGGGQAFGLRQRGLIGGGQRAQKTVTKSKAVTRTGRPGVLNQLLGR